MGDIIKAWYDGKLVIRKGNRIRVFRGIVSSPTSIRVTSIENLTTGMKEKSRIDGTMMTQPAEDLEYPLEGRIVGDIEHRDGTTYFSIMEGLTVKRKNFSKPVTEAELIGSGLKCRSCRNPLKPGGYDYDHKDGDPLNNSQENCQVLCKTCHGIKTAKDRQTKK